MIFFFFSRHEDTTSFPPLPLNMKMRCKIVAFPSPSSLLAKAEASPLAGLPYVFLSTPPSRRSLSSSLHQERGARPNHCFFFLFFFFSSSTLFSLCKKQSGKPLPRLPSFLEQYQTRKTFLSPLRFRAMLQSASAGRISFSFFFSILETTSSLFPSPGAWKKEMGAAETALPAPFPSCGGRAFY